MGWDWLGAIVGGKRIEWGPGGVAQDDDDDKEDK